MLDCILRRKTSTWLRETSLALLSTTLCHLRMNLSSATQKWLVWFNHWREAYKSWHDHCTRNAMKAKTSLQFLVLITKLCKWARVPLDEKTDVGVIPTSCIDIWLIEMEYLKDDAKINKAAPVDSFQLLILRPYPILAPRILSISSDVPSVDPFPLQLPCLLGLILVPLNLDLHSPRL